MSQPSRYDTFDISKDYKRIVTIGGRQDEDWGPNLSQALQDNERQAVTDQIFAEKAILSGLTASSLNNSTGVAILNAGNIYLYGRAEPVTGATLNYGSSVAINPVYAQWVRQRITKVQDATLVDPNTLNPVFETDQILVTLQSTDPDILDESFATFIGGVPYNSRLAAPWVLNSGTIAQGTPAEGFVQTEALQLNYTSGTSTILISPTFAVVPNTTYNLYFYTKTVYGKTDLQASDGAFVRVNLVTPFTTTFATTGGITLLGGYTQTAVTFTTGVSDTSATIIIAIPSTASPASTQILISNMLVTTLGLTTTPQQFERHYFHIYDWNRPTTPTTLTPVITPKSVLLLTDFSGTLPATDITFTPDIDTAPDITSGTVQTAIDQLSTLRALLAGNSTQVFNAANATTLTEVPNALQVQNNALNWCGVSTGTSNAYVVTLPIAPSFTTGMQIRFIANFTNTATATITINANTYNIVRPDGTQLQPGDIISSAPVILTIISVLPRICVLYVPPAQYINQEDSQNFAIDTGAANAYVVSLTPTPITPYTSGFPIRVLITNTNTGASTINVNGTGPVPIIRATGGSLVPNDLLSGGIFDLTYNSTRTSWQITGINGATLIPQEIFGVSGGSRGRLQVPVDVTVGTSATAIFPSPVTLTMPNKGTAWTVLFHTHMRTQMLAPSDTAGATTTVQTSISDGTITEAISDATTLCTANNQTKFVNIHGPWIAETYTPNQTVTFQMYAIASITGTAPQPLIKAGSTSYMQWAILSSS